VALEIINFWLKTRALHLLQKRFEEEARGGRKLRTDRETEE